jgi:hypothetical protein
MSKIFNHNDIKIDIRGENSLYVDIKGQTIYIDTSISNELIVTSWNNRKESKSDFTADWDIIQKLDEDKLVLYTELESEVK